MWQYTNLISSFDLVSAKDQQKLWMIDEWVTEETGRAMIEARLRNNQHGLLST